MADIEGVVTGFVRWCALDLSFERPSGPAMPLGWAYAESIKLRRSLRDESLFDMPPQTVERYLVEKVESPYVLWRPDHRRAPNSSSRLPCED
jgi:hypothetical protein